MSRAGFHYAMSNPGALLIAGNPAKSRKRKTRANPSSINRVKYPKSLPKGVRLEDVSRSRRGYEGTVTFPRLPGEGWRRMSDIHAVSYRGLIVECWKRWDNRLPAPPEHRAQV